MSFIIPVVRCEYIVPLHVKRMYMQGIHDRRGIRHLELS